MQNQWLKFLVPYLIYYLICGLLLVAYIFAHVFLIGPMIQHHTMITALAGWLPLPVLYIVLTYFFISWYLRNVAIPNFPKDKTYWLSGLGFYLPCFLCFVAWMGSNLLDDLGYEFIHGFIVWFFMGFVVCLVNSICHILFYFIKFKKEINNPTPPAI